MHFVTKIQQYEIRGWGKGIHYEFKRGWALGLGVSLNQAALFYEKGLIGLTISQPVEGV